MQVGSDSFPILTVQLTEPGTGTALGGTPSEESDIKRPAAFRRHASIGALKVDITFSTPGLNKCWHTTWQDPLWEWISFWGWLGPNVSCLNYQNKVNELNEQSKNGKTILPVWSNSTSRRNHVRTH